MAGKFNTDLDLSPEELAAHLRQPGGDIGRQVGDLMSKSNRHICLNAYKVLAPGSRSKVLEIGMGNGFFVKDLMNMADNLKYTGVDFSPTMIEESALINKDLISADRVNFIEASIEELPFEKDCFDYITTTNTIYFWPDIKSNLSELMRVLKPGGKLVIAYRSRNCLEQIEMTNYGFKKYESKEIESFLFNAGFRDISSQTIDEPDLDFNNINLRMTGVFTCSRK